MLKRYKQSFLGFLLGALIFGSISVFADVTEIKAFLSDIKITLNGQTIELKDTNGEKIMPIVYNGTTYLPVKPIAEAFGMEAAYNEVTGTVEITDKIAPQSKIQSNTNRYVEDGLEFYIVDGEKYITLYSLGEKYKEYGYVIGYNGLNTAIVKTATKTLLERIPLFNSIIDKRFDNKHYLKYDYYVDKIKPLIEVAETTPQAKPIEKEPTKEENKDIILKVSESFEKDGLKLTLKRITKSNTVFTFHFYYENNTDKDIREYSVISADSDNPKYRVGGGFQYADGSASMIGGYPANSKDNILIKFVDFDGFNYIRIKDTNVKWQIR